MIRRMESFCRVHEHKIKDLDDQGRPQDAVVLAALGLPVVRARPVQKTALKQYFLRRDLNFHVNPLIGVGAHQDIQPYRFVPHVLGREFCIVKLNLYDALCAVAPQDGIEK